MDIRADREEPCCNQSAPSSASSSRAASTACAKGGTQLDFGQFGLKALSRSASPRARSRPPAARSPAHMKRAGRVWIRVFPDVPVSKKPTEVRMGKGKGAPSSGSRRVKPGRIMFEIDGVPDEIATRGACASAPPSCRSRRASSSASPSREGRR